MSAPGIRQWESNQDGLDKLYAATGPMPKPGKGEVLVKIHVIALNYRDTEVCMGLYNHHKSTSSSNTIVPCSDMCGTVASVGEEASWKVGDRVLSIFNQTHLAGQIVPEDMKSGLGLPLPGVLATHRVFPSSGLVKAPDYLSDEEAATLPIAAVTAWMSMNGYRSPVGEKDYVLLQGTGGVSIAGLQIAAASGAKAIITSSSDSKLEKAAKMGAAYTINYRNTSEWQNEVMHFTSDKGADVILETGGAMTLRKAFDCISFGGLIACIGYLSGKEDEAGDRLNTNVLALRRNVTLKGILNGPKDEFEKMCEFYTQHKIHPVVDRVFSFEEAKEALQYLYSGSHFGKVVIQVK